MVSGSHRSFVLAIFLVFLLACGSSTPDEVVPDVGPGCSTDEECATEKPCMAGVCSAEGSCQELPDEGATCDDGDACTAGEVCSAEGSCGGGTAVDIPDEPCQTCSCSPDAGVSCEPMAANDPANACTLPSCESLGFSEVAFSEGPYGSNYGDIVDDFTVNTLAGSWNLKERWTGCDTYLFVMYHPDYEYPNELWNSDIGAFLNSSPENTHYFFLSYRDGNDAVTDVTAMQTNVEAYLSTLEHSAAEQWRQRLHYVTDQAWTIGTLGSLLQDRGPWAFGIDRWQQFAEVGTLGDVLQNFTAVLRGLTFESRYYNHQVEKQAFLDALGSTAIPSFAGERVASGYADFVLPDAAELATYDTLHLELSLGCGDPMYEDCGEWDYLVYAYLCDEPVDTNAYVEQPCQPHVPAVEATCHVNGASTGFACTDDSDCEEDPETVWTCEGGAPAVDAETMPCSCNTAIGTVAEAVQTCNEEGTGFDDCACSCGTEFGRWITAYARGGRWVSDASPLLAMLKDGGTRTLRFNSSYSYWNDLILHLSNSGDDKGTPQDLVPLFGGGSFNESYNEKYEPIEVAIPEDATKVVLYAVISGHGWGSEVENCAEFCNHTHHFTVGTTEFVKDHPLAGSAEGCVQQIEQGTIPNQFGTWPYGRGGWCAGKQVDPWIVDVTSAATPGSTVSVSYRGLFQGADYVPEPSNSGQGFGANIKMDSYLVIYK